ncbi:hypothetical protein E2C01_052449 [Portunus trituberculatus]|uniref:Uncharacterized protein n=1 Tax=Portunus trituberculatus TaxID=210409 RepID=A0A5B7GPE1_PORTR|nr:hypothetical protein [Portunus trituberculatus]
MCRENKTAKRNIDFFPSSLCIPIFLGHCVLRQPVFLKRGRGMGVSGRDAWPCSRTAAGLHTSDKDD